MITKKIFITGASGFLGGAVIKALANNEITVLAHHANEIKGVRAISGGLENIGEWEHHLADIEAVVHLAGIHPSGDRRLYKKINTAGTINLIEAAKRHAIKKFIFISTRILGDGRDAYGLSKKEAEEYLKKSSLTYTILRVGEIYDEQLATKGGVGILTNFIKKSIVVPFISNVVIAPIHKDDVAAGIKEATDDPITNNETYFLVGENLSMKEVAIRIANYLNLKRLFIPIPYFLVNLLSARLGRLTAKEEGGKNYLKVSPRSFLLNKIEK